MTTSITIDPYFSVRTVSLEVKMRQIEYQFAFVPAVLVKNRNELVTKTLARSFYSIILTPSSLFNKNAHKSVNAV